VLLAGLAACGGAAAEAPLTVPVGMTRADLASELKHHEYCTGTDPVVNHSEVFPHCQVPGHEFGQSWVVAHYDDQGRVWKIQRWERFSEESRGLARFNTLIEKRSTVHGAATDAAKARISEQQELPPGTRTWVAFDGGASTLVGLYLLTPQPPENAMILEEIIAASGRPKKE
jgi:hypothetical protein